MHEVDREDPAIYVIALVSLSPIIALAMWRRTLDVPTFICLTAALTSVGGLVGYLRRVFRRHRPAPARLVRDRGKLSE